MLISLIVAMAQNRVIGRNNQLPWYLPEDLKYFKRITMGKPVVMGRKTFESIGKPLPGRTNIIVTRNPDYRAEGIRIVNTLNEAKALCESIDVVDGTEETMIIGGAEIFAQAMTQADRLYLTQVHADVEGDAHFPEINEGDWEELGREDFSASDSNPYDYSFLVLQRVGGIDRERENLKK